MDLFSPPQELEHISDFLHVDKIREYRLDGSILYIEDRAIINPEKVLLYENRVIGTDGVGSIRVGKCAKYHANGQLAWELNYDSKGYIIKDNKPSFRQDGTIIVT